MCAKYLQPLTVWWDHGVPGHHAHLHVELAAQKGVGKCLFPLEMEALPVLTSNSVEAALETMPYAALRKRWQRSCLILSRGTSRTLEATTHADEGGEGQLLCVPEGETGQCSMQAQTLECSPGRCGGDGLESTRTFWAAASVPGCHGSWVRESSSEGCRCPPYSVLFV
ncbi:hypothetical protein D5F01_LYC09220 [Larimichthys crocea]|uniref:Uncharacterized protein n=1 Tax=Larimichthys crocea TaxID=215358 RepID=A0A6G0IK26_LARCR|nr:hypothetical protein D5F01_LYC09220 [Larimichthys crocea]